MSIRNEISESIKQQFSQYYDNYLAYAIHQWAANDISDSIALCITGSGDCKTRYINIANLFGITKEEVEQGHIVSIKNKIESEATKKGGEFFELISKFDQSLKEQSRESIIQILNSSAEEMLNSLCSQFDCTIEKNNSTEYKGSNINEEMGRTVSSEGSIEESANNSSGWWPW